MTMDNISNLLSAEKSHKNLSSMVVAKLHAQVGQYDTTQHSAAKKNTTDNRAHNTKTLDKTAQHRQHATKRYTT